MMVKRGPTPRKSPLGGRDFMAPRARRPLPGWVKGCLLSAALLALATCIHPQGWGH